MKLDLAVPADFHLGRTVHSHGFIDTVPFAWDAATSTLSRIDRLTPKGPPKLVRIKQSRRTLVVEVEGATKIHEAYQRRIRRMLQLHLDLRPFHRSVGGWIAKGKYGRVLRAGELYEDLVKAICGTNILWKQAVKCIAKIGEFGPLHRASGRRAFPSPTEMLLVGEQRLRDHARVGYRAQAILELSKRVASGELDLEAIEAAALTESGDQIRKRLTALRGIGPSTACYLASFLGKFDRPSIDSAVLAFAEVRLFEGRRPSVREVEAHFQQYGEWQGLVSWWEVWRNYTERDGRELHAP